MAGNGMYRTDIDCGAGAMNCCRRVDPWVLALWVLTLAAGKGLRKPAHRNKLNSCGNNLYVATWPALVFAADANAVLRFLANVYCQEKV
jgi:hypothetical protein